MQLNCHKCARLPPQNCKVPIRNVTVSWFQDTRKCNHCSAIQRSHIPNTQKPTPVLKYTSQMQHPHHLHGLMHTSSYIVCATTAAFHTQ